MNEHPGIPLRLLFAALFTAVIAAPSVIITWELLRSPLHAVMLFVGSGCWALLLAWFWGGHKARELWRIAAFRKVFWWVFGVRLAATILFPCGIALDAIPGVVAILIAMMLDQHFGGPYENPGSGAIFFLPFIQGFFLTALFLAAVSIVYAFVPKDRKQLPEGMCVKCGYDLRASKDACPECGEPIPDPEEVGLA